MRATRRWRLLAVPLLIAGLAAPSSAVVGSAGSVPARHGTTKHSGAVSSRDVVAVPGVSGLHDVCPPGLGRDRNASVLVGAPTAEAAAAVQFAAARIGADLTGRITQLHVLALTVPSPTEVQPALTVLRALPGVTFAEPDYAMSAQRDVNDPLARQQWPLRVTNTYQAWDHTTGAGGTSSGLVPDNPVTTAGLVHVAVLDTGVDARHPDLKGRVVAGFDFVNGDSDASDDQGHGTAVSGVIAADTNNRLGVAGLSWGAQILPVKVLGADGGGDSCSVAAGIVYAGTDGASIVNMSLGGPAPSCPSVFVEAITLNELLSDSLLVAASGNAAQKGNEVDYPAGCGGVFAVGATDVNDHWAKFSEHGPQVAVSAPGVDVLTTFFEPHRSTRGYAFESGTSLAAPMVAGLAALLVAKHTTWSRVQLTAQITKTAKDLGKKGRDDYFGAGRIDVGKALAS